MHARGIPVILAAALTALGTGLPGPAAASVRSSGAAASAARASLAAVSCKGPSWCMAVGSYTSASGTRHALAQIWNGTSWRVLKPPGGSLTSVSCSAAWFCMAAGGPTGAQRWNGTFWRTMPSPAGGVRGVSCGTRHLCMVIFRHLIRSWNGTRWRLWTHVLPPCGPAGPCGWFSVSCFGATNCLAVGTAQVNNTEQDSAGVFWNGQRWTLTSPPSDGNPAELDVTSCAARFCMALGTFFSEVKDGSLTQGGSWHPATRSWTDASPGLQVCTGFTACPWTGVLSCASSVSCMAFGPNGNQAWNGTAWRAAPSISAGRGSSLRAVSCGGSDCLAVGYRTVHGIRRTLAELWNGTAWRILRTPNVG